MKNIDIYLSETKKLKIPETLIKWTRQAKECFERECNCIGCEINNVLETQCVMKHIVKKIYEKCGCPPQDIELEQAS